MSERINSAGGTALAGGAPVSYPPEPRRAPAPMPATDLAADDLASASDTIVPPPTERWLDSGFAVLNAKGVVIRIDEPLAEWLGQSALSVVGCVFSKMLEPIIGDGVRGLLPLDDEGARFSRHDLRIKDGARIRLEISRGEFDVFVRLSSLLPEVSELEEGAGREYPPAEGVQQQLLTRLTQSEAQLKLLCEQWPGVVFSQRADFSFRLASPRIEELTGAPVADWQRKSHLFWELVHEDDVALLRRELAAAKASREPTTLTYRLRNLRSRRVVYVMEHRRVQVSPGGLVLGYEGVWLDVTRQTLAEHRLSRAAWKETLSILTMSLSHDFGNVMAGIHALAESFHDRADAVPELGETLRLMQEGSRQASQLVRRIIDLHQGQPGERSYHNLNDRAAELADLVRKVLPRRAGLTVQLAPQQLPVYLDAVELRQVIANLALNAVDAIGPAGNLVLQTYAFTTLPALSRHVGNLRRLPAVGISLRDDGGGLAPEELSRAFEPFFTTKPAGKGSGLGLYNARVFAESHGGLASITSAQPGGTTVLLILPETDFAEESSVEPVTKRGPTNV